jgi:NAD(P)-dependent dehydrogenase (short-subunit alcohol dehydrogenase family)
MNLEFEGKVALITGSGRGIGRVSALRLAKLGADVVINDVNIRSAKEFGEELTSDTVMDEIKALGRRSIGIEADITDKKSVLAMFEKALKEFGHVDILVNNAGGSQGKAGPLKGGCADVTEEDFRFLFDLNVMGTMFCCQAAIPHMIKQKWGRIVNISSIMGLVVKSDNHAFASKATYGLAKWSIVHYTRVLAAELGPHGIRVNCISPAAIASSRVLHFSKKGQMVTDAGLKDCPLGRAGNPDDIAKVVEFLCTDLSSYVTGQCIRVDGGRTLF